MEDFRRQLLQLLSLQNWFIVPILGQLFFWIYNKSSSFFFSLSRISCIRTSIWLSWMRRRKSRSQASWARLLTGWMRRGTPLALKSWRESCWNWESFVKPCSSEWRRGRNGPTDWQLSTACLTTPPSSSSEWELHQFLQSIHFLSFFLSFFKKQLCWRCQPCAQHTNIQRHCAPPPLVLARFASCLITVKAKMAQINL